MYAIIMLYTPGTNDSHLQIINGSTEVPSRGHKYVRLLGGFGDPTVAKAALERLRALVEFRNPKPEDKAAVQVVCTLRNTKGLQQLTNDSVDISGCQQVTIIVSPSSVMEPPQQQAYNPRVSEHDDEANLVCGL